MKLSALAPAKVNPTLFLGTQRPDGRHELLTLLESVSLADELELSTGSNLDTDLVVCPAVEGPNLAAEALAGLRTRGWTAPPVRLEIRKRIPLAAGMGGGSADAAATLRLASELSALPDGLHLQELAAGLGADVPSQLEPGLALGTGAGDVLEPLMPLAAHAFLILPSDAQLSTAAVYRQADHLGLPRAPDELRRLAERLATALRPGAKLEPELLVNDLAPAALSLCPQIAAALAAAREVGADHALVCGSGPTVAGLFWGREGDYADAQQRAEAAANVLAARFPTAHAAVPVAPEFGAVRRAE